MARQPARSAQQNPIIYVRTSPNLSRRTLLFLGSAIMLSRRAGAAFQPIFAGAIRWDAWEATGTAIMRSVETTLSSPEFRSRAPFCGVPLLPDKMSFIGCNAQDTMDAEIIYAAEAGLSFWAYCWYGATDPMMNAWNRHQASLNRNQMNWCLLLQFSRMEGDVGFAALVPSYVAYFSQANYQKLQRGRPLLYIYIDSPAGLLSDRNGTWSRLRTALDGLRATCVSAGLPTPYIVIMGGSPADTGYIMSQVGADAISNYIAPIPPGEPARYQKLDASTQTYWASMAATGAPIVPICMTGWDTRPRKQHPPSWQKDQTPGIGMSKYVTAGTPAQIAAHLQSAVRFIDQHPASCPSRSLLIYSWDECDEGGSPLIPTYTPNGPNATILNAVGEVLRAH